jgi:hypothetical protein
LTETDAMENAGEPTPPLRERVAAAVRVLAGHANGHSGPEASRPGKKLLSSPGGAPHGAPPDAND